MGSFTTTEKAVRNMKTPPLPQPEEREGGRCRIYLAQCVGEEDSVTPPELGARRPRVCLLEFNNKTPNVWYQNWQSDRTPAHTHRGGGSSEY